MARLLYYTELGIHRANANRRAYYIAVEQTANGSTPRETIRRYTSLTRTNGVSEPECQAR